jgi:hypothetical protein
MFWNLARNSLAFSMRRIPLKKEFNKFTFNKLGKVENCLTLPFFQKLARFPRRDFHFQQLVYDEKNYFLKKTNGVFRLDFFLHICNPPTR